MTESTSPIPSLLGWVALALVPRIGGRTLEALMSAFGSPRAIFEASRADLLQVPRIGPKTIDAIHAIDLDTVQTQIDTWHAAGIRLLTWQDVHYPAPYLYLPDRPPLLFARGDVAQEWARVVAIVGTRTPDPVVLTMSERLGYELARRGWLVVSGLARGVDAAAHQGAIRGGRSIAITGCGVDEIYPVSNRGLAADLLQHGALYAEVPPGTIPSPGSLMARNRLIAGLAKVVIVMQADEQGGSLETARRARQQQRHILTLDAPDYAGNQMLLQRGAYPLATQIHDWDSLAQQLDALPEPPRQLSFFDLMQQSQRQARQTSFLDER
ncbi:MAG: DNA-processing protein DprA [Anaerolineales bacterium]